MLPTAGDVWTVAMTLYGEARGTSLLDRLAVGAVIRERVLRPGWWGRSWESVCKAPWQFSCWHDHDEAHRRNREAMLRAERDDPAAWAGLFHLAHYIVHQMTDRDVAQLWGIDNLEGWPTHYFSRPLTAPPKAWGTNIEEVQPRFSSEFRWFVVYDGRPPRRP